MPRRYRMGSYTQDGVAHTCAVGTEWPPGHMLVYDTVEDAREEVSDAEYQRIRVWEEACGLHKMDPAKCQTCPQLLKNGVPLSSGRVPVRATQAVLTRRKRKR